MLDPLSAWKSKFKNLPKTADTGWADNFATAVNDLTTNKLEVNGVAPSAFTFDKATFKTALLALGPTPVAAAGIAAFALAWASAIATSTMVVASGAVVGGVPSPPTIFSVVTTSLIDAPSVILGQAKINTLATASPVANADDSLFPETFRDAFLLLTVSIIGLDSTPTPAGPLPLLSPLTPVK